MVLAPADLAAVLLPESDDGAPTSPLHAAVMAALRTGGGHFARDLAAAAADSLGAPVSHQALTDALWDLVWAGHATTDTFGPLRARLGAGRVAISHTHTASQAAAVARIEPGA